ncbi:MAG: AraC family transcriptional regulator [Sphingobium sp.]
MPTLSHLLNHVELRGTSWCTVELRGSDGFRVGASDGVMFYAVLRGTARLAGGSGEPVIMRAGDVRILLSGTAHAVRTLPDSPAATLDFFREYPDVDNPAVVTLGEGPLSARILCGKLKAVWPDGINRNALPPVLTMREHDLGVMNATTRVDTLRICAEGQGASSLLTRMATLMLTIMVRSHPQCAMLMRMSAHRDPIARALELVRSEPQANWSVASLARRVGMSRSSFAARFNTQIGRTPMEVIRKQRMEFAADLLQRGDLSVTEISARTGYRSEAGFSRRFTQFFGVPPREMRDRTGAVDVLEPLARG